MTTDLSKNNLSNEDEFEIDYDSYDQLVSKISDKEQKETDMRMLLAKRISTAMKARGWKQVNFAAALQKDPAVISRWLSGTHSFMIETLLEIEGVLNISLISLTTREEEQESTINRLQEQLLAKENLHAKYIAELYEKELIISTQKKQIDDFRGRRFVSVLNSSNSTTTIKVGNSEMYMA